MIKTIDSDLNKFRLLYPRKDRDLVSMYPGLKEYEELNGLKPDELLFSWYYSCKDSPIYEISDDHARMVYSLELVKKFYPDSKLRVKSELPVYLQKACDRMLSFDPDLRRESLKTLIKVYETLVGTIDIGIDTFKTDATKLKQYAETSVMISKEVEGVVSRIENLFVSKVDDEDDIKTNEEEWSPGSFFEKSQN